MSNYDSMLKAINLANEVDRKIKLATGSLNLTAIDYAVNKSIGNAGMMNLVAYNNDINRAIHRISTSPLQHFINTWGQQNLAYQTVYNNSFWAGVNSQIHQINKLKNFPTNTIDYIGSIFKSNSNLLGHLHRMNNIYSPASKFYSITGLEHSLGKLSSQIAAYSTASRNFALLERFNDINTQVLTLSEDYGAGENIDAKLDDIRAFITTSFQQLYTDLSNDISKASKAVMPRIADWLTLIGFILMLISNNNTVTKDDFSKFKTEIFSQINTLKPTTVDTLMSKQKLYRFTNQKCVVYNKAQKNSLILGTLKSGYAVNIFATNHKWVFVLYNDPNDGLPKSGWVIKKYLTTE